MMDNIQLLTTLRLPAVPKVTNKQGNSCVSLTSYGCFPNSSATAIRLSSCPRLTMEPRYFQAQSPVASSASPVIFPLRSQARWVGVPRRHRLWEILHQKQQCIGNECHLFVCFKVFRCLWPLSHVQIGCKI